jgi:hypothetical protein
LLDDDLRAELQAAARRMELLETLRQDRPSEFYDPHERGQGQFHAAPHIVRAMFPGNGFGKNYSCCRGCRSAVRCPCDWFCSVWYGACQT